MGCQQSKPAVARSAHPDGVEEEGLKGSKSSMLHFSGAFGAFKEPGVALQKVFSPVAETSLKVVRGGANMGTKVVRGGAQMGGKVIGKSTETLTTGARHLRNVFAKPLEVFELGESYKPPLYPKSQKDKELLKGALKRNFVFDSLTDRELKPIVDAFEPTSVQQGDIIIKEGDAGDFFYVIETGSCAFWIQDKKVGLAVEGDSFGELALLYTCPRAATVKATATATLFRLDQIAFRFLLQRQTQQGHEEKSELLASVPFLKGLAEQELYKLSRVMVPKRFVKDDYLMHKGDAADFFYIIEEGRLQAKNIGVGGSDYEDVILEKGDYVGERALVTGEPRVADIVALTDGLAFCIDKETFETVLGDLNDLILRAQDKRQLAGIKIFVDSNLDAQTLSSLSRLTYERDFKAGDVIVREGQSVDAALYLLRKGKVRVANEEGSMDIDVVAGGYFGEDQLESDVRRRRTSVGSPSVATVGYTAVVQEDCVCGVLTLDKCRTVINTKNLGKGHAGIYDSIVHMELSLDDLTRHKILGAGTFGQVWLVSRETTEGPRKPYALKVQSKFELCKDGQAKAVVQEKNIMSKLHHPFLINLVSHYKDEKFVYMLLDICHGGELYNIIHTRRRDGISEKDSVFYAACIAEGLGFMHRRGYVYRDLKPENVMLDDKGYTVIIDFGFAKYVVDKTYTLCGTPLYLPPEMILNRGHNAGADHWSMGVLIFEMLTGEIPFFRDGMDQMGLFRSIVKGEYEMPKSISDEAKDILLGLLTKDPTQRLGSLKGGEDDILGHPWFQKVDFPQLRLRQIAAPFVPKVKNPLDASNFEDWSHLEDKTKKDYPKLSAEQEAIFNSF